MFETGDLVEFVEYEGTTKFYGQFGIILSRYDGAAEKYKVYLIQDQREVLIYGWFMEKL